MLKVDKEQVLQRVEERLKTKPEDREALGLTISEVEQISEDLRGKIRLAVDEALLNRIISALNYTPKGLIDLVAFTAISVMKETRRMAKEALRQIPQMPVYSSGLPVDVAEGVS